MELTPEILERIRTNDSTLHTLDLSFSDFSSGDAVALAEALETNTTLLTLDLSANHLGPEDAIALAKALKINTTLQALALDGNRNLGLEGAIALAEALNVNTTLQTLGFSNANIGPKGAIALAEALKTNATLQTLALDSNHFGSEGATALAKALEINAALQVLNLNHNDFGSEGAAALAKALKTNAALQALNIYSNNLKPEDAEVFSEALKINMTLQKLDLCDPNMILVALNLEAPPEIHDTQEITSYIERNQAIATCLKPLLDMNEVDKLSLEEINEKMEALTQLAPELLDEENLLPDTNYLNESYRLLAALSHSKGGQQDVVIQYLETPFNNSQLQATADKTFAEAVYLSEAFKTADEGIQKSRYQCLAYQHRNEPESPFFKMAIYGLIHPGEIFTLDKLHVQPQKGEHHLLSYQALWDVAQKALQSLENNSTPEALLLTECLKQKEYYHVTIGKLFQSPAFTEALHQAYPKNTDFHCLETVLFFENLDVTYRIPTFLDAIQPITEEAEASYKKTIERLAEHAPQSSLEEKLSEIKAELCQFITALSDENKAGPQA